MSALRSHVRKELREQRTLLISIAALAIALTVVGAFTITKPQYRHAIPLVVALVSGLGVAIALGVDLFGGELRRGSAAFTARQPLGVRLSIRTKLTSFLAIGFTATLLGGLLGLLASPGDNPFWYAGGKHIGLNLWIGALALGIATWCLPISCLMPKSAATLPASVCLFAIAYVPLLLLAWPMPPLRKQWSEPGTVANTALLLMPFLGLLAGAICYRHRCKGGTRTSESVRVLGLSTCLFLPPVAIGWADVVDWSHFDPANDHQRIMPFVIDERGETAYLHVARYNDNVQSAAEMHRQALYIIEVDLQTGEYRQLRGPEREPQLSYYTTMWGDHTRGMRAVSVDGGATWIDTRTGDTVTGAKVRGDLLLDAQSPSSKVRTSHGTELRVVGDRLVEYRNGEATDRSLVLPFNKKAVFSQDHFQCLALGGDDNRKILIDNDSLTYEDVTGRLDEARKRTIDGREVLVTLSQRYALVRGKNKDMSLLDVESNQGTRLPREQQLLGTRIWEVSRDGPGTRILLKSRGTQRSCTRFLLVDLNQSTPSVRALDVDGYASEMFWDQHERLLLRTSEGHEVRWFDFDGNSHTVLNLGAER